uniref:Uncharacterized protein n=1 Tax=Arion vulgaris TaxID=1028688 RepID=A0A0B7ALI5_9EUPU
MLSGASWQYRIFWDPTIVRAEHMSKQPHRYRLRKVHMLGMPGPGIKDVILSSDVVYLHEDNV